MSCCAAPDTGLGIHIQWAVAVVPVHLDNGYSSLALGNYSVAVAHIVRTLAHTAAGILLLHSVGVGGIDCVSPNSPAAAAVAVDHAGSGRCYDTTWWASR